MGWVGWWRHSRPLLPLDWVVTEEPDLAVSSRDIGAGLQVCPYAPSPMGGVVGSTAITPFRGTAPLHHPYLISYGFYAIPISPIFNFSCTTNHVLQYQQISLGCVMRVASPFFIHHEAMEAVKNCPGICMDWRW